MFKLIGIVISTLEVITQSAHLDGLRLLNKIVKQLNTFFHPYRYNIDM